MSPAPHIEETRHRLLQVASEIFASRGFQAATVKELTDAAGTNVAAVNYHFGDKLGLYVEVLRNSLPRNIFGAAAAELSPEEQLRAYVSDFVKTMMLGEGKPAWCGRMIAHELAEPSPALAHVVHEVMAPHHHWLREIVAGITGLPLVSETVRLCAQSVTAQCVHWFHARPVLAHLWPELLLDDPEQIDRIVNHVTAFSLAGIRAVTELAKEGNP